MNINSMVAMAVEMKAQSVREQFSIGVAKIALDRMEQTGQAITEMIEDCGDGVAVSLDPSLGNIIDISI